MLSNTGIFGIIVVPEPALTFKTTSAVSTNFVIPAGPGANNTIVWDDGTTQINGPDVTFNWTDGAEKTVTVILYDRVDISTTFIGKGLTEITWEKKRISSLSPDLIRDEDVFLDFSNNNLTTLDPDLNVYYSSGSSIGYLEWNLSGNPNLNITPVLLPNNKERIIDVSNCNLISGATTDSLFNTSAWKLGLGDNNFTTIPDTPRCGYLDFTGTAGTTTLLPMNFSAAFVNGNSKVINSSIMRSYPDNALRAINLGGPNELLSDTMGWDSQDLSEFIINLNNVATDVTGLGYTKIINFWPGNSLINGGWAAWADLVSKGWVNNIPLS